MTASAPQPAVPKPSTKLLIASTLAWVAGALNLTVAVVVGIPQVAVRSQAALARWESGARV